ncbi:copper amine oxidase N-terminal domain-containing protein [Paenibacillus sp. FJAT-26967]|uniref:copper amine oxidase N-terminal domain-containing protein n=1 Tax=Paenibacillus sp. FJAT-26967 TaxID=1729690 RepID=UPI0008395335|nr:copper amine oxidase N-terminal domain-containing protein [Paenibacillus sp. FJAT-26967]
MNNGMKKSLAVLAATMVMTSGAAYASPVQAADAKMTVQPISQAVQQSIAIEVNNQRLDEAGYHKAGAKEPMIPLRAVTEALGMELTWNQADLSVDISKDQLWTKVTTGEDRYVINKMYKPLGTAPELVDNKLYVPASFANVILQGTVSLEGGTISVQRDDQQKQEHVTTSGVVTSIQDEGEYKSVQIQGSGRDGIVLNVAKETVFEATDGKALTLADLTIGAVVKAEHSLAMTMSLPPQTGAYKITLVKPAADKEMFGTSGKIEEVSTSTDGSVSIRIKGEGLSEQSQPEVVLHLSDKTAIVNGQGEAVDKSEVVEGAEVIGFYNGMLTRSLPPIGQALQIVVKQAEK